MFALSLLAGCATPGDPRPPQPPIPEAVDDLAARQQGDGVVLRFTLPRLTTEGLPLEEPQAVEIFRHFQPATAAPAAPGKQIYEVPGALVDTYLRDGRFEFFDPLPGEDLAQHAGEQAVYIVRTSVSRRRSSAESNVAAVRVFPVPQPVRALEATVTEAAIELRWQPPARTTSSTPIEALGAYRVYRAEVDPALAADPQAARRQAELTLAGVAPAAAYRDTQFEFGRAYLYVVRAVAQYEMDAVEAGDSEPLVVVARDTFPPAAPQNLVAVVMPAEPDATAYIELSWGISPEADLAGYRVYRSEDGAAPQLLTREMLLTPTFRDISVIAGRRYAYTVTALDRAGNESPPSAAAEAAVESNSPSPAPG